ncbi:MAG: hypothetical protein HDQ99_16680 [Lachnospiraceae bacterium]|nr:hypothetical protein [Lachnospiraceae bacterium]
MEEKITFKRIGQGVFYLVLLIEIGIVIVDKSAYINPIEGRLFQATVLLCMIKIVMTKYSFKEWIVMAVFFVLGALSYFATGRNEIVRVVAFVAASKNVNLRTVLKITFYTTLAGVITLVILSLTGSLGHVFLETNYGRGGIEKRYCFGLGHPNALHCMFWALMTLGIYLYWKKLKWYHCVVLEAANAGLYLLTVSRTGVAVASVTVLIAMIFCIFPKLQEKKWVYVTGIVCCGVCVIFSIFVAIYGPGISLFAQIDKYLTGRIQWAYLDGGARVWSLFSVPEHMGYFDMGFIRLFYWYGIIPGIAYIAVKGVQLFYCMKKKDAASFLVITMFVLYTVFEAHAISVYLARDYALLLMVGVWSEMFGLQGGEGYFWQPQKYLKRTAQ